MLIIKESKKGRIFLARMSTGDDILLSLQIVAKEKKIKSGIILAGVGSVSKYHYHVVSTLTFPIENEFTSGEEPLDIISIQGLIIEERVHAHISFSNIERVKGGHLEEGCIVLSFCVITIKEVLGNELTNWDRVGQI